MHHKTIAIILGLVLGFGAPVSSGAADDTESPVKVENLLRTTLESTEGIEVILSLVEIGPGASLPKHYHPGEEFVYVLEGSATTWFQDMPGVELGAGDVLKIPYEQVHTAATGKQSVKVLVFRVHREGQPDRIPVE